MSAPARAVCDQVDRRDGWSCVRCGRSLEVVSGSRHHRQRRRDGGHLVENLILLCGSGSTGCHGWVHEHPAQARRSGWIVKALNSRSSGDPVLSIPVQTWEGWYLLRADGSREPVVAAQAGELLVVWGESAATTFGEGERSGSPWTTPAPTVEARWS